MLAYVQRTYFVHIDTVFFFGKKKKEKKNYTVVCLIRGLSHICLVRHVFVGYFVTNLSDR